MTPKVSIIITTRNRAAHLRETLASFQRLQVPRELPAELLVVDNASTDDTAEVIKRTRLPHMPVRYLHEPKPGQSNARNTGMANTTGEVIFFTDDDVRVPVNWIEANVTPIFGGLTDAVAGGVKIAPHLAQGLSSFQKGWFAGTDDEKPDKVEMIGANMAFGRYVLRVVRHFDPELGPGSLGFGDDTLFSRQLLEAGFRIHQNFNIAVEHHFDESRLKRAAMKEYAKKSGCYKAYICWHWNHEVIQTPWSAALRALARLNYYRFIYRKEWRRAEILSESEMLLLRRYSFVRHYLIERKRRRNYALRGLRKVTGLMPV